MCCTPQIMNNLDISILLVIFIIHNLPKKSVDNNDLVTMTFHIRHTENKVIFV